MKNGVVIIGAGHGGVQAAASLREEGYDGRIVLIGDEAELPYHKPPLSKTFIKDPAAQPQILRAEAFFAGASIELALGERVASLDPAAGRVTLASGTDLPFDKAVLATGSRPRTLTFEGGPLGGVLSLRSIADARLIRDLAAQVEDVVVLGGGFIGLEIAATLAAGGRNVTVVEAQDRLLARAVAPAISAHVAQRLSEAGVRILLQTMVGQLEGENGHVSAVVTSTGERVAARMLIVGIGVTPSTELAEAAGITIANGIRVDQQMRSSAPDVLAIGDCASYRHWLTGEDVRLESVQNATDQARLAARTITGHADAYSAVPWFWSDIGDMKLQMVGLTARSDSQVVSGEPADNRFSVFHFRGGRLAGIESVNRPADHMLGRKMMGAGFSPDAKSVAEGADALKAAFADWQSAPA
ncbi:NAD(P)/FAD-dependent oxidoreductase [Mesorhizobium sp. ZMM04-5]|uniref:NAD(P)/FAD-dependent oxidoreductase n=1 Tax=Mesorhizobium marinum TaxID=3228790 RepID=A0ABV3QYT7_9HYPH